MKCEHCGADVDKSSNFCPVCGSKVNKNVRDKRANNEEKDGEKGISNLLDFKFNKNKKEVDKSPSKDVEEISFSDNKKEYGIKYEPKIKGEEPIYTKTHMEENENKVDEDESKVDTEENPKKDMREDLEEIQATVKDDVIDQAEDNEDFRPDPLDRMDKENRRYENLGDKATPYNQRSVIEEVQAKVYRNKAKKRDDKDYYIDEYKSFGLNKNIEDRLDKLINDSDNDLANVTISEGIRKVQSDSKKQARQKMQAELIKSSPDEKNSKPSKKKAKKVKAKKEKPKKAETQKPETKEVESAHKKYLSSRNILLGLIGILLAVILAILYMKKTKAEDITIPLSEYINLSYEGEDGSAIPRASIDTEKLITAYGDDIKYISRDNNKDSYESAAQEFVADLENNVVFQYSKDSGLSNGDEITVMANLDNIKISDKYNVLMSNASKAVIIDGISNNDFTDPFTYIDVKFEGESPDMTLTASLIEGAPEFMHTIDIIPAKSNGIQAGEDVAVSLNFNEEELKNTYNVSLAPTSKNFTAPTSEDTENDESSETDTDFIKTTAHLDDEMLGELKHKAGDLIRQTILYKNIITVDNIDYLGSFTGINDDSNENKVYLIYEVETSETLPDSDFKSSFKYYTFVEYRNVKKAKDAEGRFYSEGPITTDNQIFHKFFVESDYKYYQIEYQGFGFIDKALANVGVGLEGLNVTDDNKTNITNHFATSDGVVGEYEADGRRLSLREDGSLIYQTDKAVHLGSYSENGGEISATIKGVNVDTPITMTYEAGILKAESQGEFDAISFNKIENF